MCKMYYIIYIYELTVFTYITNIHWNNKYYNKGEEPRDEYGKGDSNV